MRIREGKSRGGVIELTIRPRHRVVAAFASSGERLLDVIHRRRSRVVVVQVARNASGAAQAIVVVDVAIGADARRGCVRIRQGETYRAVIEGRGLPGNRSVALLTILRKSSGNMVWIRRSLKILQMARGTRCAG